MINILYVAFQDVIKYASTCEMFRFERSQRDR
jgi:hypothetical protein